MKNYKVYLIRNRHDEIIYCGLTGSELSVRFDGHKQRKKGLIDNTCKIELVQEWLTLAEAATLERVLIKQYNLLEKGLNKSPGSINGFSQNHSEDQKRKWSEERKGKPVSSEHAEKNRTARLGKKNSEKHLKIISEAKSKPVLCVETGKIYSSAREAAKDLNLQYSKISLVCNGIRSTTGGYHFKFVK